MSEPIRQARSVSSKPFTPKMPECVRDMGQKKASARKISVDDVLEVIRVHGPVNRTQLAVRLGIAPQGLNTLINQLSGENKIHKDADGYRLSNSGSKELAHPVEKPEQAIEPAMSSQTRSLDEPTEHLFDAELTAALGLITARVKQPVGIKPLPKDDYRVAAFSRLIPMLSDDLAEAVSEILDYVTGELK